jgi:hypothetical protein
MTVDLPLRFIMHGFKNVPQEARQAGNVGQKLVRYFACHKEAADEVIFKSHNGETMAEIDTLNKFGVASGGKGVTILMPPRSGVPFSADDALLLAAYLVSMAEHSAAHTFEDVLGAVQNT